MKLYLFPFAFLLSPLSFFFFFKCLFNIHGTKTTPSSSCNVFINNGKKHTQFHEIHIASFLTEWNIKKIKQNGIKSQLWVHTVCNPVDYTYFHLFIFSNFHGICFRCWNISHDLFVDIMFMKCSDNICCFIQVLFFITNKKFFQSAWKENAAE